MKKSFNQQLRALQPWQQLAFSTSLAQRASINYLLFCDAVGFLGSSDFNKLLNLLWESQLNSGTKVNWAVQLEKIPELQPQPEDFAVYGVYPALDAALGLELALEQALLPSPDLAPKASRLSRATVRKFLIQQLPEDFASAQEAAWVKEQPLMQDEQDFQDELLFRLNATATAKTELLKDLRELAYNQGFSNLGISLN